MRVAGASPGLGESWRVLASLGESCEPGRGDAGRAAAPGPTRKRITERRASSSLLRREERPSEPLDRAMASAAPTKNNPSDFLKTVLGRPVVVKLNSGVDYRGASLASAALPCALAVGARRLHRLTRRTCHAPHRRACVLGWLHEHCDGADGGVRQRPAEGQVRRHVHPREQRCVVGHATPAAPTAHV